MRSEETKHIGTSTKHIGTSTKHIGTSTKSNAEDVTETYSSFGSFGDYEVITTPNGESGTVYEAVTIRVLDRGELNLITDTGEWYLFAANAWSKVAPAQPKPGKVNGDKPN
jgi:hypothetical protein